MQRCILLHSRRSVHLSHTQFDSIVGFLSIEFLRDVGSGDACCQGPFLVLLCLSTTGYVLVLVFAFR